MFSQSNTDWSAQLERLLNEAKKRGVQVATPMIGEIVTIGPENYPNRAWWSDWNRFVVTIPVFLLCERC